MSDTVETAPRAAPRATGLDRRRAAREAKASRENRIIASSSRSVSVAVIAEWEDVTENARAGSRHSRSAHAGAKPIPKKKKKKKKAKRIRPQMAPQRLQKIKSGPGNGMVPEAPDPQDMVQRRDGGPALALDPAGQSSRGPERRFQFWKAT